MITVQKIVGNLNRASVLDIGRSQAQVNQNEDFIFP